MRGDIFPSEPNGNNAPDDDANKKQVPEDKKEVDDKNKE